MMRSCLRVALVLMALTASPIHAQTPAALTNVQRLKCAFTQRALGTWDKEAVPSVELTPAKLSMVFDAIDTQDGTANVIDVTAPDAGAPHITVRLEPHGGHCGFISNDPQRQYLAETTAADFLEKSFVRGTEKL